MKKKLAILVAMALMAFTSISFAMDSWLKMYSNGAQQRDHSIIKTSDGGSLITGCENYGAGDGFAIKLDSSGDIVWKNYYSGERDCRLYSSYEVSGGYFLVGTRYNSTVRGLILLVDKDDGSVLWQREYGGIESIYTLKQVSGGNFMLTGHYSAYPHSYYVLIKMDTNLDPIWRTAFDDSTNDQLEDNVFEVADGDFITRIPRVKGIARLDGGNGEVQWVRRYKVGSYMIDLKSIHPNAFGQFALAGQLWDDTNRLEFVVSRIDEDGFVDWPGTKKIAGQDNEWPTSITATSDGDYLVTGTASLYGAPYSTVWLFKLNQTYSIVWQKELSDGIHKFFPSSGKIKEYNGEIYYTSQYQPDLNDYQHQSILFAKLTPGGETGENCSFINDLALEPQNITLTVEAYTPIVDYTLYGTNSATVTTSDMVGMAKSDLCTGFYPTLSVDLLGPDEGRVEGKVVVNGVPTGDPIINCGDGDTDCWEILDASTQVQLTMYPNAGYAADYWDDGVNQSSDNPLTVTVSGDAAMEAVFQNLRFPVGNGTFSDRTVSLEFGDNWLFGECPTGTDKKHAGIDVEATKNEVVRAAGNGKIKMVGYSGSDWKWWVTIEHSSYTTVYWHLENPSSFVEIGDDVDKNQQIGIIADLGDNTHFHFGIRNSIYSNTSNRGALPLSECGSDPAFPEYFIDPETLTYE